MLLSICSPSPSLPPSHVHKSVLYVCISIVYVLSHFSHVQLFATLWTVACQAPLSMRFSGQAYWSRLPGDLPHLETEPVSLVSPSLAGVVYR